MQAIIITAYKDKEQLIRLIRYFNDEARLFVHIDAKCRDIDVDEIKALGYKNLFIHKKYRIRWASVRHLWAILEMMEMALGHDDVDYIHTMSGQDLPLIPLAEWRRRFDGEKRVFMDYISVTGTQDPEFLYRLNYPFPSNETTFDLQWMQGWQRRLLHGFMRLFRLKRNRLGRYAEVFKGLVWLSLPADAARYAVEQWHKDRKYVFAVAHSFIPEEFFFQTLLMNSPFAARCANENLRFMDWSMRPKLLTEEFIPEVEKQLAEGRIVLARKVDSRVSAGFIRHFQPRVT